MIWGTWKNAFKLMPLKESFKIQKYLLVAQVTKWHFPNDSAFQEQTHALDEQQL